MSKRVTYYAEFYDDYPSMVYAVLGDKCWYWVNYSWTESQIANPSYHFAQGALAQSHNQVHLRDIRGAISNIKAFKYIEPQAQEAGTQPAIS